MNPKASEFISLFIDENLKKGLKDVCLAFLAATLL
jgi:hypothetical protein